MEPEPLPPDVNFKCGKSPRQDLDSQFPLMKYLSIPKEAFKMDRKFKPKGSARRIQLVIETIKLQIEEGEDDTEYSIKSLRSTRRLWGGFSTNSRSKAEAVVEGKNPNETFWEQDAEEKIELEKLKFAEIRQEEEEMEDTTEGEMTDVGEEMSNVYGDEMLDICEEENNNVPFSGSCKPGESWNYFSETAILKSAAGEQETMSLADELEISPTTGKLEIAPVAGELEIVPVACKQKTMSIADELEIAPVAGELEIAPVAGKQKIASVPVTPEKKSKALNTSTYLKEDECQIIDRPGTKRRSLRTGQRKDCIKPRSYFNPIPAVIPLKVIPILPSSDCVTHPQKKRRVSKLDSTSILMPREYFKGVKMENENSFVLKPHGYFGTNAFFKVHSMMPIKADLNR